MGDASGEAAKWVCRIDFTQCTIFSLYLRAVTAPQFRRDEVATFLDALTDSRRIFSF